MSLVSLVITLALVGVLLWLVRKYVPDATMVRIITIVVVIAVVIWLLGVFGLLGNINSIRVGG